jgi:hypothetical protein
VAQIVNSNLKLDKLMESVVDILLEVRTFDALTIQLLDETDQSLNFFKVYNPKMPSDRLPKEIMFVPALVLLGFVWFLQRGRRAKLQTAEGH